MLNITLKNMDRLCLMITLSVTLIFAGLVFQLNLKRQKETAEKSRLISQRASDLESTEQKVKQLEAVLGDKRTELKAFNDKIPETPEFGEFLDQLDRMMKQRNLALISVQPQGGVAEKTLTKIPVRMIFNGTFINIFNMIHAMETTGRTVVMENISIAKSNLEDNCRVQLLASIFSR